MSFESIKASFANYLENLKENSNSQKYQNVENGEYNIFQFSSEFKDFLESEFDVTSPIQSMSVDEILAMDVQDGKLITFEDLELINQATNEATNTTESNTNISQEINMLSGLIGELSQNEDFINTFDVDGDKQIDNEEIEKFLNIANSLDGDTENLTVNDLMQAMDGISNGTSLFVEENDVQNQNAESIIGSVQVSGTSAFGGATQSITTSSPESFGGFEEESLEDKTEYDLEIMLGEANNFLNDAQNSLSEIKSGQHPALKALQANIDNAYEQYIDKLKYVDEELAGQVVSLEDSISQVDNNISKNEMAISQQDSTVETSKNNYAEAQAKTASIQSQLSQARTSEQDSKHGRVKSFFCSLIQKLLSALTEAQKDENEKKQAIDREEKKLKDLEDKEKILKEEKDEYEKQLLACEREIHENKAEVAKYLDIYKSAQKQYDEQRAELLSAAQINVNNMKKYVGEIEAALETKKESKALAQESTGEYSEEAGNKLLEAAEIDETIKKPAMANVNETLQNVYGKKLNFDSANQVVDALRGDVPEYEALAANFKEIDCTFDEVGNLPVGAIVVYGNNAEENNVCLSIMDGKGNQYFDTNTQQSNLEGLADGTSYPEGTSLHVFLPVA